MASPFRSSSLLPAVLFLTGAASGAEPIPAAHLEFFEAKIRPVLIEQCYACHNSAKTAKGGLALDDRASTLRGGTGGPIVVAGKPEKSRLIPILRHAVEGQAMPKDGPKLDAKVIADFEKWIALGLPDPRDKPPTAEEIGKATFWATTLETRKKWWSFRPIRNVDPPPETAWAKHPIDRFIADKLRRNMLEPNAPAEAAALVRRLFFAIIGLPPTPAESDEWATKLKRDGGYDALVDHLLASPHFGERWARHWMDWTRYADSHGSEGDPDIAGAWHYRDYLIRALNADVPYDRLVREHIAGDLLAKPRIDAKLKLNESAIGPAHWRMIFHGYAPTDALEEKVRFIDDEINTFSKAFLGLTVSCARCHDHKFDAIGQKDYTAIFGVLASNRPGRHAVDSAEVLNKNRAELEKLKPAIRTGIAKDWHGAIVALQKTWLNNRGEWVLPKSKLFDPVLELNKAALENRYAETWKRLTDAQAADRLVRERFAERAVLERWNFADDAQAKAWFRTGVGLEQGLSPHGEFAIAPSGDKLLTGVHPRGFYSDTLSTKHAARLESPRFKLEGETELWLRVCGDGGATLRCVVQDYPRDGTVFPVHRLTPQWHWHKFDLSYWAGDEIHIELAHALDAPVMIGNSPRSRFGIREAMLVKKGEPGPPETREYLDPIFDAHRDKEAPSPQELAFTIASQLKDALGKWNEDKATEAQVSLLQRALEDGILPNSPVGSKIAKPHIDEYRKLEAEIAVPTRVPGLMEGNVRNQALMERGDHKRSKAEVPRRFLEAIDATPYSGPGSGRLQLAEDLLSDKNPLTRRVIVNRLWHHLFGTGIVPTPDNFGRLGLEPTHPELLDFLADRFREKGWSIKDSLRFIVTSKTWQQASKPSVAALQLDPENRCWSHAAVRRLEAEAIRDSLLAVSGSLAPELFGPPADGNSARRSVYVRVRRTALDPFLRAFDFPEPFSTTGRRDATNVPAQALTLMNDPRVAALASALAGQLLADPKLRSDDERIARMVHAALGRAATAGEIAKFDGYIAELKAGHSQRVLQHTALREQLDSEHSAVRALLDPVRARLLTGAGAKPNEAVKAVPAPIDRWDFTGDLKDTIGTAHAEGQGGAALKDGGLKVGGRAYAITAPLAKALREKTLEVWVQLDSPEQAGGAAITVQTKDGGVFDAIVFGEKDAGQWLAGSNGFVRTRGFDAPKETQAVARAVHFAIAYGADGTIAGYRDGEPYGKPYKSGGPHEFKAGEAVVGFGIRHSPAGGNKMLAGKIVRANLYDKALSAEEVRASARSAPFAIPETKILEALKPAERDVVAKAKLRIATLEAEIAALGPNPASDDRAVWADVAKAIFGFREFITIK